jgi:superfamily II DNA helicase RecQ
VENALCIICRDSNLRKKSKHARQVSDLNNTAFFKRPKIMQSAMDQSLQSNTQSIKQLLANSLCEYFGSKRAKFRSSYQQEAIKCVIDQHPSVLYINGTNSKKSLTFFLPTFIKKRKYHVILTPLVSLKGNLLKRAKSTNLNAAI